MTVFAAAVHDIHNKRRHSGHSDTTSSLPIPMNLHIPLTPIKEGYIQGYYTHQSNKSKKHFDDPELDIILEDILEDILNTKPSNPGTPHDDHTHDDHKHDEENNSYQIVLTPATESDFLPLHNPYFTGNGTLGAPSFDSKLSLTPDSGLKFVNYEIT